VADLLKTGTDWLAAELRAHAAAPILYRRDATELSLVATPAATRTEVVDQEGASYLAERRDFLLLAADLAGLHPPRRGDKIVHDGREYEILPRGPDEDVWRWSDRYHQALRVYGTARAL
jgi:hypothetical protein